MIIVADTSPLLQLARIGRLDLVAAALGQVLVPHTAWSGLIRPGTRAEVVGTLRAAAWIRIADDPAPQISGWAPGRRQPSCSRRRSAPRRW